jgi:hypothetical protein
MSCSTAYLAGCFGGYRFVCDKAAVFRDTIIQTPFRTCRLVLVMMAETVLSGRT